MFSYKCYIHNAFYHLSFSMGMEVTDNLDHGLSLETIVRQRRHHWWLYWRWVRNFHGEEGGEGVEGGVNEEDGKGGKGKSWNCDGGDYYCYYCYC